MLHLRSRNSEFAVPEAFLYVYVQSMGKHPHIVELLGQDKVDHVMVMEQGNTDLYKMVKKLNSDKGVLEHMMRSWAMGICQGVSFMHACGYVHQDLKSSNVLVFDDRTVKVCDFGLARKKPENMMVVDRELCTLWYRAPELLMCESMYSHKIDEWSVGCILLEMVIGSPPFRGKPECICQCPQVTHRNFNSDQLARIFLVVGSPCDKMVKRLPCQVHIRGWPKAPRKLERTIEKMMVPERFRSSTGKTSPGAEVEGVVAKWSEILAGMLELDPKKRWMCSQVSDALEKMSLSEKCSQDMSSSSPNATVPEGPKAASPHSRFAGAARDTSPLLMTSPERDMPGRQIPSCYSQFSNSNYSRLSEKRNSAHTSASSSSSAGSAASTVVGSSPGRIASSEKTLCNILSEKRLKTLTQFRGNRDRNAGGCMSTEFGRTRSRSHSPERPKQMADEAHAEPRRDEVMTSGRRVRLSTASSSNSSSFTRRLSAEKQAAAVESKANARQPKGFGRTSSSETPHRLEGNFVDRLDPSVGPPEPVVVQRRVVETESAPAALADGTLPAAAASGAFLQRRRSAANRSSLSPNRAKSRVSVSPQPSHFARRGSGGLPKMSSADLLGDDAFGKERSNPIDGLLSRTCEVKPLSRTCEADRGSRFGTKPKIKDAWETRFA